MALSLVCIVLMPCVRFYYAVHRSFEEDIFNLQLPAIIDSCFLSVEEKMREQMATGTILSSGRENAIPQAYTSQGVGYHIPYGYSINIRKEVHGDSLKAKICLADVVVELFPDQKQAVSVQRCLCVAL
ncbi:type II secretion system protein [Chlamydia serpentis]